MHKEFYILLIVVFISPLFLCSCSHAKRTILNTKEIPGNSVNKMMERAKNTDPARSNAASHQSQTNKNLPKNVMVTKKGVIIYKDTGVTNVAGPHGEGSLQVGPGDVNFHSSTVVVKY